MSAVEFKVDVIMRKYEDGVVMLEITPDNDEAELSPQQILDAVAEYLLWNGAIEITEEPVPESLDS